MKSIVRSLLCFGMVVGCAESSGGGQVRAEEAPSTDQTALPALCTLPAAPGTCKALMPRFYFDGATGACEPFNYGGCEGNENNFETIEECQATCGGPLSAGGDAGPGDPGTSACAAILCGPNTRCEVDEATGEGYCADTCEGRTCPSGTRCELVDVQCIRAPCPPVAECVPAR